MTEAPLLVKTQHRVEGLLPELRAGHVAILVVAVFVSQLLAPAGVPHKTVMVATGRQRVVKQPVVSLVARRQAALQGAHRGNAGRVKQQHACYSVAAVHQRGRTLQDLHRAHRLRVNLNAVLIAPLLALLPHTVADGDYAVEAKTTNHGFRYAAARSDLCHTGLLGNGINQIGGCRRLQVTVADEAYGCRRMAQACLACQSCYYDFVQFQMLEEDVGRVGHVLCCHAHANGEQWQKKIFLCHGVFLLYKVFLIIIKVSKKHIRRGT